MEQKVESFIKEYKLLDRAVATGVGVSGGIDSMVLLHILMTLGYPVAALHFEHGIRGEESRADAAFVRQFCLERGIPFIMESGNVPLFAKTNKLGLEAAARALRYDFFNQTDTAVIATAHHMDDQAETVLMNIIRGCGIRGLAGMDIRSGKVVRPFLCVSRAEIEAYAAANSIPFRVDSTNFDTCHTRNLIRHKILGEMREVNPAVREALVRLSQNAEDLDQMVGKLAERVPVVLSEKEARIAIAELDALDNPVAAEVLMRMCGHMGGRQDIEGCHIKALRALNKTGKQIPLKHGLIAKVEYGTLIISKKRDRIMDVSFCVPLLDRTEFPGGSIEKVDGELNRNNKDKNCESFGQLPKDAVVRNRRNGDVFAPFGSGEKKLKEYMINAKMPREERDGIPLVAVGNRIIWVVGYAISRDFAAEETNPMITLRYRKG